MHPKIFALFCIVFLSSEAFAQSPLELRIGRAGHAFDHLGGIGNQAAAAAASGATIIYATGLGGAAYGGIPPHDEFQAMRDKVTDYNHDAKAKGIQLSIGYLCATSIVKLDTFDKNWTDEFRAQFKTPPAEWRQLDRQGKPLVSWYGGDYQPACMNNPDWRTYERAMVKQQLETGHDGIFFDNPTVHPNGCYCPHCLKKFGQFRPLQAVARLPSAKKSEAEYLESIRKLADQHREEFLRFRCTIARDFLTDMRSYARKIKPRALMTCNNSLNSPAAFYSQCRTHGYNIDEMSKEEDLVVVEDMNSQPRTESNGQTIEYGPMYKMLQAISHGKPVVAVTIANSDYHTPPNLMRLAMAEAAANGASYLSWPTWPEAQRQRMIEAVRRQADFLRRNEPLLNGAPFRTDVAVMLPFQQWVRTDQCAVSPLVATLTKENIQFKVVHADDLLRFSQQEHLPVLLVESRSVLPKGAAAFEEEGSGIVAADEPDWLQKLRAKITKTSILVKGAPGVRAVVHDQPGRTIVHLYNLNVQRITSFDDNVTPARDVELDIATPLAVRTVSVRTADEHTTSGALKFQALRELTLGSPNQGSGALISTKVPRLDISAILVIEP